MTNLLLTERTDSNVSPSLAEYFCYDQLNRLTSYAVNPALTTCPLTGGKTVTYNIAGGISTKSDTGSYSYPVAGPGSVHPNAVTTLNGTVWGTLVNPHFDYDNNGNMVCIHRGSACTSPYRTISWTSFDMVAAIAQGSTTVALAYDDAHSRITQSVTSGGTTTSTTYLNDPFSGTMSEKTVTGTTTTWHDYIPQGGGLVAERDTVVGGTPTLQYFTLDELGSVAAITDAAGSSTTRLSYDAWGKRRNPDGSDDPSCTLTAATTRGYTGHEEIDPVCLINANARMYDPTLGRFASADSTLSNPFDSQSLNRYSYVNNRPLSLVDPSGNDDETVVVTAPRIQKAWDVYSNILILRLMTRIPGVRLVPISSFGSGLLIAVLKERTVTGSRIPVREVAAVLEVPQTEASEADNSEANSDAEDSNATDNADGASMEQAVQHGELARPSEYSSVAPADIAGIVNSPLVREVAAALRSTQAYIARDPYQRHEGDIWIYENTKTGELMTVPTGSTVGYDPKSHAQRMLDLPPAPSVAGWVPVLYIHTHPFPLSGSSIIGFPQFSAADIRTLNFRGVAGMVISRGPTYYHDPVRPPEPWLNGPPGIH